MFVDKEIGFIDGDILFILSTVITRSSLRNNNCLNVVTSSISLR